MPVKIHLREIRIERGLSQKALSEKTKLTVQFISKLELGKGSCTLETIGKFCQALQVQPGYLLTYTPD